MWEKISISVWWYRLRKFWFGILYFFFVVNYLLRMGQKGDKELQGRQVLVEWRIFFNSCSGFELIMGLQKNFRLLWRINFKLQFMNSVMVDIEVYLFRFFFEEGLLFSFGECVQYMIFSCQFCQCLISSRKLFF